MNSVNGKIRVLQSLGSLTIGGNEIFVMNLFRNIDRQKFEMDFVIYDDSEMDFYDEIISNGSRIYILNPKFKNKILKTLVQVIKLKKILINNNYNIIHCHSCSFIGIFRGVIAGKLARNVKIISHSHNSGTPKNNMVDAFIRYMLKTCLSRLVDLGFACSDVAAESKYTNKFMKSNKFAIINNSIDINKFLYDDKVRKEMRNKYKFDNEIVIGNIGRLDEQKNQKFLLKIFSEIRKRNICAKLLIVGDGDLLNELKKDAVNYRVDKDTLFVGKVADTSMYYQMMDVFVLTSLYEGFPFVMVEAQVNGLPSVISSQITKTVDISGMVKFVSLKQTEEEWADIIINTVRGKNNYNNIKYISKKFSLEYQVHELEKFYEKLVH